MTIEQIVQLCVQIGSIVLGGGVLGIWIKSAYDSRTAKQVSKNEAARDVSTAWDAIVESLQLQITTQTNNFTEQMTFVTGEVKVLKEKVESLQTELTLRDRTILKAIAHIGVLEALVPPKPVPERPEELK